MQLKKRKKNFYEKLKQVYNKLPKCDVKIKLGYCNAKVGKEKEKQPVAGLNSKHMESNNNGCKLIEFAFSKGLVIKGACLPRKDSPYADDVVLSARSTEAVTAPFKEFEAAAKNLGLEISETKSKYFVTEKDRRNTDDLQLEEYNFERADSLIYLGSEMTPENKVEADITNRIKAANRSYRVLCIMLKSKHLRRLVKLTLYKTVIKPVLMYGSKAWVLTEALEKKLNIWERKVLRKVRYGKL
ncbi:uncharacterized protein LOC124616251 [Schistocerca americana]|uniref:uncharacterized protein LOC124616251 n=1 Tax=Schistocerca americana TaxID=7009 RepID=UPI001F4F9363|nr:uncharacterized protein LOC124616251 [Schistocerca americana]